MKIAIIPARGGSKRIKKKNIIDFNGAPMISYPLAAAKKSGLFSHIHVSTDNDEIASVVEGLGYKIDFRRSDALADDYTPVLEVARYVLKEYQGRGVNFDSFALIMPCSPLLAAEDLQGAYAAFEHAKGEYPVLSVCEYPAPIEWAFAENADHTISVEKPELLTIRSQDLKKRFYDTGTFCVQKASAVIGSDSKVLSKFVPYVLHKERSVDIDSIDDLRYAEYLAKALNLKKATASP